MWHDSGVLAGSWMTGKAYSGAEVEAGKEGGPFGVGCFFQGAEATTTTTRLETAE